MGIIIFNLNILIEAVFAAYCIATKSYQYKLRNWIKISMFLTFVLLALVSVIPMNLQWCLLAIVLLIRAIVGTISLILLRKKDDRDRFKVTRVVLRAVIRLTIMSLALAPVLMVPNNHPIETTGEYRVMTADYTYRDEQRTETFAVKGASREVNVEFFYPDTDSGKFPLVVFSHGAFGVKSSNTSTMKELASNGYVVCAVDHPYHAMYTRDDKGKVTLIDGGFLKEVMDTNKGVYDAKTTLDIQHKWLKLRTDDLSFVLDTIKSKAALSNPGDVYSLVDDNKIGLIGHSLGGAASVQLGRDRSDIDAVVNLDGDMLGEYLDYVNGQYVLNRTAYTVPLLNLYSDDLKKGFDRLKGTDTEYPQKLVAASDPHNYDVFLTGTNHLSLTDLPIAAPYMVTIISGQMQGKIGEETADPVKVIETMNRLTLEFFNQFLKGEGSFQPAGTY